MRLDELTRACVHCGICLTACPTYRELREEADSPRGRVLLLDALARGEVSAAEVRPHVDRCLGCLACETACPSGVPYGALLEAGRATLGAPLRARVFLRHVVVRPLLVRALAAAGRLVGLVPPRTRPRAWPAPPARPRGRIALHLGCVTPHLFPSLAADAAFVLARLGFEVTAPPGQTCCGALHRHAGLPADALAARNAEALDRGRPDLVVSAAAGCSTTPGITDVTRVLLDHLPLLAGARLPAPRRVAYDAPCHLLHAQGIDAAPLLDAIDGVERVALPGADRCCGAAGLYMTLQPGLARAVRAPKIEAILATGASVVSTPNPGCMLWLWRGLRERRAPVAVVHPVSLLAEALAAGAGEGGNGRPGC